MLGAVLLCQHHGRLLQDLHWRTNLQDTHLAGLLELGLQSDHLFDFQQGVPWRLQTYSDHAQSLVLCPGCGQHTSAQQRSLHHGLCCQERGGHELGSLQCRTGAGLCDLTKTQWQRGGQCLAPLQMLLPRAQCQRWWWRWGANLQICSMRFGCGAHNNDCGDRGGRTNGNRTGLTGLHSTLFWVPTRNCEAILQSLKPKRYQNAPNLSICLSVETL